VIWKIAKKEFLLNLMTFKFAVGTILGIVLMAVFMPILASDYQQRLKDYSSNVSYNEGELAKIKVYQCITPTIYRRPSVLSVFSIGLEKRLSDSAKIELKNIPIIDAGSAEVNPYLSVFPIFDAVLIIKVVIGVLALILATDLVSGEKQQGTLILMLSNSIARHQILFGKTVAGLMVLTIPVTATFIVGLIILQVFPLIDLSAWDWARVGLMYIVSLIFVFVMFNVGLLFSCLSKNPAISLLLGLFFWILCGFVIPNLSIHLASKLRPQQTAEILQGRLQSIECEYKSEAEHLSYGGTFSSTEGAFGNYFHYICDQRALQTLSEYNNRIQPLNLQFAARNWEAKNNHLQSLLYQRELARNISIISPLWLYEKITDSLAETDLASFEQFMTDVGLYRSQVIEYIRSRTNNFSSREFFTTCTPADYDQLIEFEGQLKKKYKTMSEAKNEYEQWQKNMLDKKAPLDLRDFPRLVHNSHIWQTLKYVLQQIMMLVFFTFFFFALTFAVFQKYDVR